MTFLEKILSQFFYVHLLKEQVRLLKLQFDNLYQQKNAIDQERDKWRRRACELELSYNSQSHNLQRETRMRQELEQRTADAECRANGLDQQLSKQTNRAEEYRQLFLEEKAKHQQALELVADWQAQRLHGRQIFNHAPLLQPDKPMTREHMPIQRRPARDVVREETEKFMRGPIHHGEPERGAPNLEFASKKDEMQEMFDQALKNIG